MSSSGIIQRFHVLAAMFKTGTVTAIGTARGKLVLIGSKNGGRVQLGLAFLSASSLGIQTKGRVQNVRVARRPIPPPTERSNQLS